MSTGRHDHGDESARGEAYAGIETDEHLAEHLAEILKSDSVIICVGNDLSGDDAAGVAVAEELGDTVPWKVYNTQTVPESFLMKIVADKPASVVLVDALHFNARPGAVEIIQTENLTGQGPSTHGPAPLAFLDILKMMHPAPQAVLGIQPTHAQLGAPLSEPVRRAVGMVVRAFRMAAQTTAP